MKRTFTVIRKWADIKGFKIEERSGTPNKIYVIASKDITFELSMKESTIYTSIRGKRGNPAGLYLTTNRRNCHRWYASWLMPSQRKAIQEMEKELKA